MKALKRLARRAELRERAGLNRELSDRDTDDELIDLASNDYLGLSRHPRVVAAAREALATWGLGAGGSRAVRGTTTEHSLLERDLADQLRTHSALVYSSGYLANLGLIGALAQGRTRILLDAHSHASLHDAARRSTGLSQTWKHNDLSDLRAKLDQHSGPTLVVCESVYSVCGDAAPLSGLHALVVRHPDALLIVDEAHALGVTGPSGAGEVVGANLAGSDRIIVTATLSKALGAAGGVVAGPEVLRRHLQDTSRPFIYDTALPPSVAAGAREGLRIARESDLLRAELATRAATAARELGVVTPAAGVLSIPAADAYAATHWATACRQRGVAVGCFRPPSTPDPRSRLRVTINSSVSKSKFRSALNVIKETRPCLTDPSSSPALTLVSARPSPRRP
ncbi:8-amino-7-oxononanoate synthase [Natronoglycomyces albus]|uniref:8-amino-7-oxononanoate synthase n=1 Tax=Natronoglycomyces albus TaxID=2811108 RepID=A0A895XS10_9ACTN|nr:8-amino-7-oxononanoate synthase [Natronoglycomyces albus]QSB06303.1 8-amino-7-oxononanoate synthase [Natronoglycomyces albus]